MEEYAEMSCVIDPESGRRLTWDMFGIAVLLIDLVMIPMQVFEIPETSALQFIGFTTLGYWTMDIFMSANSGYFTKDS